LNSDLAFPTLKRKEHEMVGLKMRIEQGVLAQVLKVNVRLLLEEDVAEAVEGVFLHSQLCLEISSTLL